MNIKRIIDKTFLSLLFAFITGCAGMQTSFEYQKPSMNPDILNAASSLAESDEIRYAVKNGIMKLGEKDYDAAMEFFQSGLRLNPRNGHLHFLHAMTYHLQSLSGDSAKLDMAETGYTMALKFDPGNYWAAYLLGQVYFKQQRYIDAQNQFSYGLLIAPRNEMLLKALSVVAYYNRQTAVGNWAANRAYTLSPDNPATIRNLMFQQAAVGNINDARNSFTRYQKAVQISRGSASATDWSRLAIDNMASRIAEWDNFYHHQKQYAQAYDNKVFGSDAQAEGTLPDLDSNQSEAGGDNSGAAGDDTGSSGGDSRDSKRLPRMALIDVVILRSEESRFQNKGVNLLEGLRVTIGGTLYGRDRSTGIDENNLPLNKDLTNRSPTVTINDIHYNLNIFNDGVNQAEVLARPSLLALEDRTSKFFSGAFLHVQLTSNFDDGSLEEIPVGLHLEVTPHFHNDNTVEVIVHAQRDDIEDKYEEAGFVNFSQTSSTSVDATAVLKFGETLILSGLSEHENNKSKSGVPLLQNIPIIQYLFSREEDQQTKKSVIILLTPHKPTLVDGELVEKDPEKLARKYRQKEVFTNQLMQRQGIKQTNNIDSAFALLAGSELYQNFRDGDLKLDDWHDGDTLAGALKRTLGFLYY